jgi:hypothetical protein
LASILEDMEIRILGTYGQLQEMVVLGQWPFTHTRTLEKMFTDTGVHMVYYVDDDRIIPITEARKMVGELGDISMSQYHLDEQYFTLMGEILFMYMRLYMDQIIPPPIHESVSVSRITEQQSIYDAHMLKVQDSAAVLLVGNQSVDLMKGIGCIWNHEIGIWIVDSAQVALLRKQNTHHEGKVFSAKYFSSQIKIWGDTSKHIPLFRELGAIQDKDDQSVWYLKMSQMGKVSHIITK